MSPDEENELLRLTRENNYMLKRIMAMFSSDNDIDFISNVIANLLANRIERR